MTMGKSPDLPRGFFHHPRSSNIYFKIKKWDEQKGKFVWSSPISSGSDDLALAIKAKKEAQALSDELARIRSDVPLSHAAALRMVNVILRWHDVPEIASTAPLWSEVRDKWLATQKTLLDAGEDSRPGIDPLRAYKTYCSRVRLYDTWLDGSDPRISDVHREDCQAFYEEMLGRGYKSSTILNCIAVVKRIFEELKDDQKIKINPWSKLRTIGSNYRQNDPFTAADIQKIWANLNLLEHADEWRTVILFALTLGAREKDCTLRTWEEIRLDDPAHIIFSPGKTAKRKHSKHDVKAPLVDPLFSWLREMTGRRSGFITPRLAQETSASLSRTFSEYIRDELKLPMRREEGIKTWYSKGFHSWRHTLPSLLAANDVPPEVRMAIVGHTDSDTHHQYTHHDDARLRKHLAESLKSVVLG